MALPAPRAIFAAPQDAIWTYAQDFDEAIRSAVQTWLEDAGVNASVSISRDEEDTADVPTAALIPLSGRTRLCVVPTDTATVESRVILETLWRYVDTQRRLLHAEELIRQEGLVLASSAIRRAHRQVIEAAGRGLRLMILGPTGAGKEGLARAYHAHSGRTGPFVALNCSELNKELFRAEVFGAEEGAFTGSVRRIIGAVEQANGGTLFLDELGELPIDVQPMLLRFLDRGEYVRLGSYSKPRHADVRIIGATNRDLRDDVKSGRFREDLWFRLSLFVVDVPGLRDRFEDVKQFLQQKVLGDRSIWSALAPDAKVLLQAHPWDGNFRELCNFALRLGSRDAGEVDADSCRQALVSGSLRPPQMSERGATRTSNTSDWPSVSRDAVTVAAEAFHEDRGGHPESWNDVKDLIENYLKPVLFARLSGAAQAGSANARTAPRLGADRGTALRQIDRYFERFSR